MLTISECTCSFWEESVWQKGTCFWVVLFEGHIQCYSCASGGIILVKKLSRVMTIMQATKTLRILDKNTFERLLAGWISIIVWFGGTDCSISM